MVNPTFSPYYKLRFSEVYVVKMLISKPPSTDVKKPAVLGVIHNNLDCNNNLLKRTRCLTLTMCQFRQGWSINTCPLHIWFSFTLTLKQTYHSKWVDGYNFKTVPVYGRCNKLTLPLLGVFPFNHWMGKMHPNYKLLLTYKVENTWMSFFYCIHSYL